MARIRPLERDEVPEDVGRLYDEQIRDHGRMTNMKKTLGHCGPALAAYMEWYTLRGIVAKFLGDRSTIILAHAISTQTDCLICGTFFRRFLIDAGENPDDLSLSEADELLVEFGRQYASDAWGISDDLFARLRARYEPDQIVALVAFAGLMVATNLFNNALRVELDDYLAVYRKKEAGAHGPGA